MTAAFDDARALAVELSRGRPSEPFDAMKAGLVLWPEETAYRSIGVWLSVPEAGAWASPSWTQILVTDRRLLCRCDDGRLVSLPWCEVVGVRIELGQQRIVLNHRDWAPFALIGVGVPVLAVATVGEVFGLPALLTHPGLSPLRH